MLALDPDCADAYLGLALLAASDANVQQVCGGRAAGGGGTGCRDGGWGSGEGGGAAGMNTWSAAPEGLVRGRADDVGVRGCGRVGGCQMEAGPGCLIPHHASSLLPAPLRRMPNLLPLRPLLLLSAASCLPPILLFLATLSLLK